MSLASQGVHGSGSRDYRPQQVAPVVAALLDGCATVAAISARTGIPGRTVRTIISDHDGGDFLLGGDGNGYQLAGAAQDAERLTRRLQHQVDNMTRRIVRRRQHQPPTAG